MMEAVKTLFSTQRPIDDAIAVLAFDGRAELMESVVMDV